MLLAVSIYSVFRPPACASGLLGIGLSLILGQHYAALWTTIRNRSGMETTLVLGNRVNRVRPRVIDLLELRP